MTTSPKVSIVIPVFNDEKYIEPCINSVLSQTFKDFELILVDDCSTDSTFNIVREKFSDDRIRIVQNETNSGISASRNHGIDVARGEYIYFMDHDDEIFPHCLDTFVSAAEESGAGVVLMNSYFFDYDGVFEHYTCKDPTPRFLSEDIPQRVHKEYYKYGVFVMPWIRIQRRELLTQNRIYFPLVTRREDCLFNVAEMCLIDKIQVIDECGYIWRQHPTNTSKANPKIQFQDAIGSLPVAINYLNKIVESMNLPDETKFEFKDEIERRTVVSYFGTNILEAYRGELTQKEIDSTISEILQDHKILDPNLMRVLFNVIAKWLIK